MQTHPLGLAAARRAVAAFAGGHDAERVVLTASTSEAYMLLFKLCCDPGDAVAVPAPSYPLFDVLAELEAVRPVRYRLELEGRWRIDLDSVAAALAAGARAVLAVSPNNPTGSCPSRAERDALVALCAEHGVPLIADEVFAHYGADGGRLPTLGGEEGPLIVVLDGLSKAAALPQLKLGWLLLYGGAPLVEAARERLAWIADAYLSVGVTVQAALPRLLEIAGPMRELVAARVQRNRGALIRALEPLPAVRVLPAEGGWYAVLRVPCVTSDEALSAELAEQEGVLLHPGYFYDFLREGHLVACLLREPERFDAALGRLVTGLTRRFS